MVYRTVDLSGPLRARQEEALSAGDEAGWDVAACADFPDPSSWSGAVRRPASAVVVGNELLDALPVHRVDVRGAALREAWVRLREGEVGHVRGGVGGGLGRGGGGVRVPCSARRIPCRCAR